MKDNDSDSDSSDEDEDKPIDLVAELNKIKMSKIQIRTMPELDEWCKMFQSLNHKDAMERAFLFIDKQMKQNKALKKQLKEKDLKIDQV